MHLKKHRFQKEFVPHIYELDHHQVLKLPIN